MALRKIFRKELYVYRSGGGGEGRPVSDESNVRLECQHVVVTGKICMMEERDKNNKTIEHTLLL